MVQCYKKNINKICKDITQVCDDCKLKDYINKSHIYKICPVCCGLQKVEQYGLESKCVFCAGIGVSEHGINLKNLT